MADPKLFISKNKPIIYIKAFVQLYNQKNHRQIFEINGIIKLEKIYILIAKNFCNLGAHQIIKILLVLHSAYIISMDKNKLVFNVNNYIDWDKLN